MKAKALAHLTSSSMETAEDDAAHPARGEDPAE
jgi:hypothetical protein